MSSPIVLCFTAALMALVAIACTALCIAWSVPSFRHRLAQSKSGPEANIVDASGLTGWPARVGSGLVSTGIAACAFFAAYGCYCILIEVKSVAW